jgi:hypothetical protein
MWRGWNGKWKVEQKEYLESDGEVEIIQGRNKTVSLVGRRRRKRRIREEIEVRRGIKVVDIAYSAIATLKRMPYFPLACKTEM